MYTSMLLCYLPKKMYSIQLIRHFEDDFKNPIYKGLDMNRNKLD